MANLFIKIVAAGIFSIVIILLTLFTFPAKSYAQLGSNGICTGSIKSGGATNGSVQFSSATLTADGSAYRKTVPIRDGRFSINIYEYLADSNNLNGSTATFFVDGNDPAKTTDDISTGVIVSFSYPDWLKVGPADDHRAYICNKLQNIPLAKVAAQPPGTDVKPILNAENQEKTTFRFSENATIQVDNVKSGFRYSFFWSELGGRKESHFSEFDGTTNGAQKVPLTMPPKEHEATYEERTLCVERVGDTQTPSCIPIIISEIPTIDYNQQESCIAKVGEPITFTATGLIPGRSYQWHFTAAVPKSEGVVTPSSSDPTTAQFEVTSKNAEKERVCVNLAGEYRDLGTNCIDFINSPNNPKYEISCKDVNTPDSEKGPTPRPPLPPCYGRNTVTHPKDTNNPDDDVQNTAKCRSVFTSLGFPLSTDPEGFVKSIFSFLLSISGGILLLIIIFSGYQLMTSHGDPEKTKAARERITSAIVGFLFLVFSFVILQVIGVDILRIPGFCGDNDADCQEANVSLPTPVPTIKPTSVPRNNDR
jgi:hypothetical protein